MQPGFREITQPFGIFQAKRRTGHSGERVIILAPFSPHLIPLLNRSLHRSPLENVLS
jgi:hypothetical protein